MQKSFIYIILLIAGCFFAIHLEGKYNTTKEIDPPTKIKITKIVDGDTFWAIDEKQVIKKYRLIGIDAPETSKNAKNNIHPYGKTASQELHNLLNDSIAYIHFDKDSTDRYKRLLVYLYNSNHQFLNYELVRNGHATIMNISPNSTYKQLFKSAQDSAIVEKKGIWKDSTESR